MIKKQINLKEKVYLIDGHALSYRSFYAIRELANSKGQETNAIYGFINALRKIIKEHNPEYIAVCFDSKERTHRQEKYSEYKIQRPPMPNGLISQLPLIKKVIEAFNIPIFECPGFEADDIIATITKKFAGEKVDVVIVSEDKDMFQLVDQNVHFFSARKDAILGRKELTDKLGFDPGFIIDFIGLAGDKSDNIPGVMGIGEVTARKLINEYGSLENILSHSEELKPEKLRLKIVEQKESAIFSKELAVLDLKVPLDCSLEMMKISIPDRDRLYQLFMEWEFKRLAQEYSNKDNGLSQAACSRIDDQSASKALVDKVTKAGQFAFFINIQDDADPDGIYVALSGEVFFIAKDHLKFVESIFTNKDAVKINLNYKENLKLLKGFDFPIEGKVFDVMLAGYLLEPSRSQYELTDLAWEYCQVSLAEDVSPAQRAQVCLILYAPMLEQLTKRSLLPLLNDVEIKLAYVLFLMEDYGVKIDVALLKKLSDEAQVKIDVLTKDLFQMAGEEFNLNSPKQLSKILFDKLGLPVIKKTKTGFSTNEEVLKILSQNHEFPSLILSYRQLAKLKSTYLDALPKLMDESTGKIHTQYNQVQTETGRLSSAQPNLQNIPIRTEFGRRIRAAIIPSNKDWTMMSADYSQIELRILAHLSKDSNLINAFKGDQDIHQYTASLMFDVKEEDVTQEMRYSAKRVNFGIIYGMSSFGLAKDLGVTQMEAQDFIDRYFSRYPGVKQFMDNEIKKCEKNGYVLTLLNRRRYIPEINSKNVNIKQFAQRQAINTPVQGSAADLMKLAMINIQQKMEDSNLFSRMLITVHDELVFDVVPKEREELIEIVRHEMENSLKLDVLIKVSIKEGVNWLDMKEVK